MNLLWRGKVRQGKSWPGGARRGHGTVNKQQEREMKAIEKELKQIAKANDGVVKPEDVVEFASDKSTALHKRFTWDDSKAAHQHRLWQARQIIAVHVTIIRNPAKTIEVTTRQYVSLPSDRKAGNGYRTIEAVMADKDWRKEMMACATRDMQRFQEKYEALTELSGVFTAMKKVQRAIEKSTAAVYAA